MHKTKNVTAFEVVAAESLADALSAEMAQAIDGQQIICGGKPQAEYLFHRDIHGKRRRIEITVTMVDDPLPTSAHQ